MAERNYRSMQVRHELAMQLDTIARDSRMPKEKVLSLIVELGLKAFEGKKVVMQFVVVDEQNNETAV